MAFFSLISLIIPLGLGIAGLFAAILAHRGQATAGTWALIISSGVYFLSLLGLVGGGILMATSYSSFGPSGGSQPDFEVYEIVMMVVTTLLVLSLLGYSIGILLMGLRWKTLSQETEDLEILAQELAMERDPVPAPSPSIS